MLSLFKKPFEKRFTWILPYFKFVHPNVLTFLGLLPPILFYIFLLQRDFLIALCVLPFSFLDMLDGAVARKFKKVTVFGGVIDSVFDRVSDFLYIIAFSFSVVVRLELSLSFLLLSFLISYMRARGTGISNDNMPGIMERPERIIGLFIALLSYILFPGFQFLGFNPAELVFIVLLILSIQTFFQRMYFVYQMTEGKY